MFSFVLSSLVRHKTDATCVCAQQTKRDFRRESVFFRRRPFVELSLDANSLGATSMQLIV